MHLYINKIYKTRISSLLAYCAWNPAHTCGHDWNPSKLFLLLGLIMFTLKLLKLSIGF